MKRPKLAALAVVLVLIGAGSALAAYIILSNSLDYDVTVQGEYITLEEVSAPSTTFSKGTNYTYEVTATVNSGSWNTYMWINITSDLIEDGTHASDFDVYMNDTSFSNTWDSGAPNQYQAQYLFGTWNAGEVYTIYVTINFDYGMPSGAYNILMYFDGEAI